MNSIPLTSRTTKAAAGFPLMKILRHISIATVGLGLFCAATPSVTAALRFEVSVTPGLATNALKGRALADASDTRTEEQKAIDRLLVQWQRVVEGGAAPDASQPSLPGIR